VSNATTQQQELSNKAPSPIITSGLISDDYDHILDKLPDAVIAKGLRIHGEAKFSRLLRIDGAFEGVLLSDGGSLIVGETGEVTCDISNLQELYVEGRFVGDIGAEKVQLRKGAIVKGNITCCSLGLDPSARFKGSTNITPRAKWTDKQQASDSLEMNLKAMADSRHNSNLESRHYKRISSAAAATKVNSVGPISSESSPVLPASFEDEDDN
jgi:cytoskeletal protein CcmA (bactofilin family)